MEHQYSETMKKLIKKQPSPRIHGVFLLLMVLLLAGSIYGIWDVIRQEKASKGNAVDFTSSQPNPAYSRLTPDFMLPAFATSYDDRISYCFTFDTSLRANIVALWAENMGQCQKLIDYTLSEDEDFVAPDKVTLQGMPVKMESDLIDMAIKTYNYYWGSDKINKNNYQYTIGSYYLDTTQGPVTDTTLLVFCVTFFILTLVIYLIYLTKSKKVKENGKLL